MRISRCSISSSRNFSGKKSFPDTLPYTVPQILCLVSLYLLFCSSGHEWNLSTSARGRLMQRGVFLLQILVIKMGKWAAWWCGLCFYYVSELVGIHKYGDSASWFSSQVSLVLQKISMHWQMTLRIMKGHRAVLRLASGVCVRSPVWVTATLLAALLKWENWLTKSVLLRSVCDIYLKSLDYANLGVRSPYSVREGPGLLGFLWGWVALLSSSCNTWSFFCCFASWIFSETHKDHILPMLVLIKAVLKIPTLIPSIKRI